MARYKLFYLDQDAIELASKIKKLYRGEIEGTIPQHRFMQENQIYFKPQMAEEQKTENQETI
jgi:hypothetical protein